MNSENSLMMDHSMFGMRLMEVLYNYDVFLKNEKKNLNVSLHLSINNCTLL